MRFPLIGEWNTPNTPGSRIPSHGTNALGTRYAYDFLQLNWKKRGHPCYRSHVLSYLLFGVALSSCYCYGLPVYAPCDGRVVYVMDGCRERKRAWFFSDALMAFKNSRRRQDQEICEISGNAVIIQYTDTVYAAFCHLQPNSIAVAVGQYVKAGDFIGSIGHSGNSMFPIFISSSWTVLIFCMRAGFPAPLPNMRCWKTGNGTLYTEVSPQHSSGYAMPR